LQISTVVNPLERMHPDEWALYQPLVGSTMLELGGKKNVTLGIVYKDFFQSLGYRHTSVDWNGDHGALKLDLQLPLGLGTFDMVTNIGTTEHVSSQQPVWRNIVEACHIGTVFISTTPKQGHWTHHGEWYPNENFYEDLAAMNGFEIERINEAGAAPRGMWHCRMIRRVITSFSMPVGNMYHNII